MHTAALWLGQFGAADLATKNAIARNTVPQPSSLWWRFIRFDCRHFSECGVIESTAIRSRYAVNVVPFVCVVINDNSPAIRSVVADISGVSFLRFLLGSQRNRTVFNRFEKVAQLDFCRSVSHSRSNSKTFLRWIADNRRFHSKSQPLEDSTGSTLSFGFEDNGVVFVAAQTKANAKFLAEPSLRDAKAIQFAVPQSVKGSVCFRDQFENGV
jgi:hypothetical protein